MVLKDCVEKMLGRESRQLIGEESGAYYTDKVILISGGGGSVGSELCRQLYRFHPKRIILLDICENGAYDVQQEIQMLHGAHADICIEIASVCDREALEVIFSRHHPQIVLHAAAHKHVQLMERNCCEAVKNNVFGTLNMVELSERYAVDKFILISTDKAVNPVGVMGATKRMCEMIVRSRRSATCFSAVRFGNVLGSNGSVVPLFMRQIEAGGPLTITDRRIIRYFMSISEAAQLVLQSGVMSKGAELYVLNMGEPVRIIDLAEQMIRMYSLEPYRDIEIIQIGLRGGEKLYEEPLIRKTLSEEEKGQMIFEEAAEAENMVTVSSKLERLREALCIRDDENMKQVLRQVIPDYRSANIG